MMKKYYVFVPEVHYRRFAVEADSVNAAMEAAQDKMSVGPDDGVDLEFSHVIDDMDKWMYEELDDSVPMKTWVVIERKHRTPPVE